MAPARIGPRLTVLCWIVLAGSAFADQAADEATYRDALLPLLRTSGLPLSYLTNSSGQEVDMRLHWAFRY